MQLRRTGVVAAFALGLGAGAAPAADEAASTAGAFVGTLDARQREAATFPFDTADRTRWAYVPQPRTGLALVELTGVQREAAYALVDTGLSERGGALVRGIVDLEAILQAIERRAGSPMAARRDKGLYFLSIFGAAGNDRPWAWSFEGHHLSVNATHIGAGVQIVAPLFMGANPARLPGATQPDTRLLGPEEDRAFELLHLLDARQQERAVIGADTFGDIVTRSDPVVANLPLAGLPAAEMSAPQQRKLRELLALYAGRMTDAAAAHALARIDAAGFGRLHFAWAGARERGAPHYYRIHGPTVLVEYDNSQDGANHVHTVWRDLENDFGGDLLRRHHAAHRAGVSH